MKDIPPRCPFCANVIKHHPTFWERIGLRSGKAFCPTCRRRCEAEYARMMGSAYWHWAEHFRGELTAALHDLPVLPESAMYRALGDPNKDETELVPSVDELVRQCLHHHRAAVVEKARGREATLEVAPLRHPATNTIEAIAILGTCSAESGSKESEQIVARHSISQYVLFTHRRTGGADPRVRRAIHARESAPRVHTNPAGIAGLHEQHAKKSQKHVPHHN